MGRAKVENTNENNWKIKDKIRNVTHEILKFIPLIIACIFLGLSFIVCSLETINDNGVNKIIVRYFMQVDESFAIPTADIIISLIPMIFTIITISLSLPAESICGVKNTTFRRTRLDYHFRFIEMIVITIIIFVLFTISTIFSKTSIVWILDGVSIYYSLRFVFQEIPLLVQNEKHILKIVRKNLKIKNRYLSNGKLSKSSDLEKIIKYIILNQGIKETYFYFKYKRKKKSHLNAILLEDLLIMNNDFLYECINHKEYISKNSLNYFNDIDLQKSIDVSLDSLKDIFAFSKDFNLCEICNYDKCFNHLIRMVLLLKKLTYELSMNEIYNSKIGFCLRFLSYSLLNGKKSNGKFISYFIKSMLISTISENELWFIRLLRDSEFYRRFNSFEIKAYLLFISMYLYYIINIDSMVPSELKDSLYVFFKEASLGINSDGSNWYNVIEHTLEYSNFDELTNVLPMILTIYGEDRFEPWYCPKNRLSWSSSEGLFDKKLLIHCWLEIVIYSYQSFDFIEEKLDSVIDSLSECDKKILAYELSENWFKDAKFAGINFENSYLSLYKTRTIKNNNNCYEKLTSYFFNKKNLINLNDYNDCSNYNEFDYEDTKKYLINGFNSKKQEIEIYDSDMPINSKKEYFYSLIVEREDCQQLLNFYIEELCNSFKEMIRKEIEKNIPSNLISDINKTMNNIVKNYHFRSSNIFDLYSVCDKELLDKVSDIKESSIWLPDMVFWKRNSMKFNIECIEDKTLVRDLNSNEIDYKIDTECKVTDGLYKFNNGDDKRSVFVDRNKIYEIVSKKYFYVRIVFKYDVYFDKRKIKRLKISNIKN